MDFVSIMQVGAEIATIVATVISMVSLWLAIKIYLEARKPHVVAGIECDTDAGVLFLVLQNLGECAAYDVAFPEFDEAIVDVEWRPHVANSFLKTGIPLLLPAAKRTIAITSLRRLNDNPEATTNFVISYRERGLGGRKKRVQESFVLDCASFTGGLYVKSDLFRLRNAVERSEKDLHRISKTLSSWNDGADNRAHGG